MLWNAVQIDRIVGRLRAGHAAGHPNLEYALWNVLMFQVWLENARPGEAHAAPTGVRAPSYAAPEATR